MDDSLLVVIPSIHATILTIIFAVVVVFYFTSYQIFIGIKGNLDNQRNKISQMRGNINIFNTVRGSMGFDAGYFKDGSFDISRAKEELFDITKFALEDRYLSENDITTYQDLSKPEIDNLIEQNGRKLLDIVIMLSINYPYSERMILRDNILAFKPLDIFEYNECWANDLFDLNQYLSYIWQIRNKELIKFTSKFQNQINKKRSTQLKEELSQIKNNKVIIDPQMHAWLYSLLEQSEGNEEAIIIIVQFFDDIEKIQTNIIPKIKEYSYQLKYYQEKLTLKSNMSFALFFSIAMLLIGIIFPLCIKIFNNQPLPAWLAYFLPSTFIPYLLVLVWYLIKIFRMRII